MDQPVTDFLLFFVTLGIGFYTLTYARWLWQRRNKRGALGVLGLTLMTVLYTGFVLFFVHV